MIVSKTSNYIGDNKYSENELYTRQVDFDINSIITSLQGRIRFGTPTSGRDGENISGQFVQVTTSTANTEFTVPHTIGSIPVGYLVLWQDVTGSFYQGPTTGTDWTSSNIYLKCSGATVTVLLFLIK